jgi:hypothetical protein
MNHPDPLVAQAADDFDTRFRETRELIRAELKDTGEQRTTRRVLDDGCALERGALLTLLGHGKTLVVRLGSDDDELPRASDERIKSFLKGLVGDGPRLGVETLRPSRPMLEAMRDETLATLNTEEQNATLRLVDDQDERLGWPTCPPTT